ncbi:MAG: hypothetical protein KAT00_03390 [Planctomycetes bacterium]|nr:hypothetical protein [Planctomycetota bacterium]
MTNFLNQIESWNNGVANPFAGDGTSLRLVNKRRANNPAWQLALRRFREVYGNAVAGHRNSHRFVSGLMEGDYNAWSALVEGAPTVRQPRSNVLVAREAISTSDFPLLFGDTIDRLLLAKYQAHPATWRDYIKVSTVRDFRDVKRFKCSPGRGLLPALAQGESYKADKPSESSYSFAVGKYGNVRNIFWEALVNDDLGALADTPEDFAFMSAQTEWYQAAALFVANTTLYNATHAVLGTNYSNKGTALLTDESLAAALSEMGDYPGDDADGTPIMNDVRYVVVGTRQMEFKANQILNSPLVMYTGSSDTGNLPTNNLIPPEVRNAIQVRYNPFLRMLDTTNYETSWYLFSDPSFGYAVEFAFLAGYEAPSMFVRVESQTMLGGLASPSEGGFDNDAVDYKVRHVMGGSHTNAVGGWRFSWWSDGTL